MRLAGLSSVEIVYCHLEHTAVYFRTVDEMKTWNEKDRKMTWWRTIPSCMDSELRKILAERKGEMPVSWSFQLEWGQ